MAKKIEEKKPWISDSVKDRFKLGVGAALFAPKLAAEDILRACKVKVPAKGIFYNDEDKSIMDIWKESKPVQEIVL